MRLVVDYFYIASGIASLLAFFGFLTTSIWPNSLPKQAVIYLTVFTVATAIFWVWFYFGPINVVRERIWERTIAIRIYNDTATGVGVAEGDFYIDETGRKTVILPPFQSPPEVTLYPDKGTSELRSEYVTGDAFTVYSNSSMQYGKWNFRARGKLLDPRSAKP